MNYLGLCQQEAQPVYTRGLGKSVRYTECPPIPTQRTHVPRERPDQLCHVLGVEEAKLHVAVLRVAVTAGESTYE